jgi:hypothetical protein
MHFAVGTQSMVAVSLLQIVRGFVEVYTGWSRLIGPGHRVVLRIRELTTDSLRLSFKGHFHWKIPLCGERNFFTSLTQQCENDYIRTAKLFIVVSL